MPLQFRKKALDHFKTPDRLDELVTFTDVKWWLVLFGFLFLVGYVTSWLFVGSIYTRVFGTGMLIVSGGIYTVTAEEKGRLIKTLVDVGDTVMKNDVVAEISQDDLKNAIHDVEKSIQEQRDKNKEKQAVRYLKEEKLLDRVNDLNYRLKVLERMVEKGLVIEKTLIDAKEELNEAENALETLNVEGLADIQALRALVRKLDILKEKYERDTKVTSPYSGTVISLLKAEGAVIDVGTEILKLEPIRQEESMQIILYVPAVDGKLVQPQMQLKISPSNIQPEMYGFLRGRVQTVSSYPSSINSMMRILQNQQLVNEIIKDGTQVEIMGELNVDNETVSGYQWTTKAGPNFKLQPGTICKVEIQIEEKKPIDLMIPYLRKKLGFEYE